MQPESGKYLYDIRRAIERILSFVAGKEFESYLGDDMLRSAVERQLIIVGEAISQLSRVDAETAEQLRERRQIIAFRNVLAHLYGDVNHSLVWDVIRSDLPVLSEDVQRLLQSASEDNVP